MDIENSLSERDHPEHLVMTARSHYDMRQRDRVTSPLSPTCPNYLSVETEKGDGEFHVMTLLLGDNRNRNRRAAMTPRVSRREPTDRFLDEQTHCTKQDDKASIDLSLEEITRTGSYTKESFGYNHTVREKKAEQGKVQCR